MIKHKYTAALLASAVFTGALGTTSTGHAQDATADAEAAAKAKEEEEKKKWEHTAGLGFTLTGGNADTMLFTADYVGIRKWNDNELGIGAAGGYGESDGLVNNNYVEGFGQYNRLFGPKKRWFAFGRASGRHDEIADIAYRVPVNAGLGYYFLKKGVNNNEKFNLAAEVGPGYTWEKVGGVTDSYANLVVGERFSYDITKKTKIWQLANYSPSLEDFNNYTVNFELGVETSLVGNLVIRSVFTDSYRGQPAPGRKNNDYKFITSIGYKF